ncbi:DUF6615 family protein [Acinetobacter radioresistens]|uniref:DUF6615 family protein n=1 Tax=Acinetobacter radioresistens TaxID=40216 RepID=UPI0022476AC8|nr:DUF6615 family protein [Acinetobacter radioresistens]MCX0335084.1 hypothetical protein [Acinetobacter radioresistens]
MTLCETFREQSYRTWMQLRKARSINHQLLEESITDFLMMELKYNHPLDIQTITFNKHQEGKNGADWEWWFVDSAGIKGIGFRVQAKIINFKTDSFLKLHYKNQTQKLISQAKSVSPNLIPIYCLYTHSDKLLKLKPFHIGQILFNYTIEHFGCSILSAEKVQKLKSANKNTLLDLVNEIYPWHLLVCPNGSESPNNNLPERVNEFVKDNILTPKTDKSISSYLREVPEYIRNISKKSYRENQKENDEFYLEDLKGIMIIQDKN